MGVAEHPIGERLAIYVHRPLDQYVVAESGNHPVPRLLARTQSVVTKLVGIDHLGSAFGEQSREGRLAGSDPTGQPYREHVRAGVSPLVRETASGP